MGISPSRALTTLFVGLGALVLAWSIVRVSAENLPAGSAASTAALVAPDSPDAVLEEAARRVQLRGEVSEETQSAVRAAAADAPLSAEPLLLAGFEQIQSGNRAAAELLLREARRRDPRSRMVRLMLLDQFLRTNQPKEAATEIAVLTRLVPSSSQILLPELVRLAEDPETRPALLRALESDPLLDQLLEQLARRGEDPRLILELAAGQPQANGEMPGWAGALISSLIERGEIDQAYQMWRRYNPSAGAGAELVIDGDFAKLRGAPPFGWDLTESSAGFAELASGGALYLEYYGREQLPIARQLLRLSPGSYRLKTEVGNVSGEGGGEIQVGVACASGQQILTEASLRSATTDQNFEVPGNGCPGQWLSFSGKPAEFPRKSTATVDRVQIERIGS